MNRKTLAGDRRRRKLITALWALGLAAVVITLIYLEKTAILYILCTLGVTVLLMIVAFSDLAHGDVKSQQLAQAPDAGPDANKAR
jgi:Flp pilus assembly protein TadB